MRLEVRAKNLAEWFDKVHGTLRGLFGWGTGSVLAKALDPDCLIATSIEELECVTPEGREEAFTPVVLILAAICEKRAEECKSDKWQTAIEDVVAMESAVGKVETQAELTVLRIDSVEELLYNNMMTRLRGVAAGDGSTLEAATELAMRYLVASAAAHYRLAKTATSQRPAPVDGLLYLGGQVAGDSE